MARVTIMSHWCKLIEDLQMSPLGFYELVEEAIKRREVPGTESSRIEHKESGAFAAKREYLRVQRKNFAFDICGAPFGTGFFVSSWFGRITSASGILLFLGILFFCAFTVPIFLKVFGAIAGFFFWIFLIPGLLFFFGHLVSEGSIDAEDAVLTIPIFGALYNKLFNPFSYYKIDTAHMYQAAIHAAVVEAVDQITSENGVRGLTELERKPVMQSFVGGK